MSSRLWRSLISPHGANTHLSMPNPCYRPICEPNIVHELQEADHVSQTLYANLSFALFILMIYSMLYSGDIVNEFLKSSANF